MGEVLALVRKGGIDSHLAYHVLTSSLFDSRVHKTYGGKIIEGRFSAGFAVPLATKDLHLALAEAEHIPKGADLVLNEVSGAAGFWIGNVIVLAGVPSISSRKLSAPMRARAISVPSSARSPRPIAGWQSAAIRSSIRSMVPILTWC